MKKIILRTFVVITLIFFIVGMFYTSPEKEFLLDRDSTVHYAPLVDEFTPYEFASTFYGISEVGGVNNNNPVIVGWAKGLVDWYKNDETPWCSLFQNYIWSATGHEYSGSLLARSWLNVGEKVLEKNVRPGDIVVLWRKSREGIYGHVGQVVTLDKKKSVVWILGGNQGNTVGVNAYPLYRVLEYRRPRKIRETINTDIAFMVVDSLTQDTLIPLVLTDK